MNNEKLLGYILSEQTSSENKPVILNETASTITFDAILQQGDVPNRNGRIYPTAVIESGFRSAFVKERLATNSWMGESEHPDSNDPMRLIKLERSNVSHFIKAWRREGNNFIGTVQTAANECGKDLKNMILENGLITGFSLRGFGPTKKTPKGDFVCQPFKMITYDAVTHPSHKNAYMANNLSESVCIPIYARQLQDMHNADGALFESLELLRLLEGSTDFEVTPQGNLIAKDKTSVIQVGISDTVRNNLKEYFSGF